MQVMCEGTTPSADLVATVKRLYETKLKVITSFTCLTSSCNILLTWYFSMQDATILIPILSTFTKDEVFYFLSLSFNMPLTFYKI